MRFCSDAEERAAYVGIPAKEAGKILGRTIRPNFPPMAHTPPLPAEGTMRRTFFAEGYSPMRWRTASKSITAAAAETLSDSMWPMSGMASCSSQSLSTSFEMPVSSAPMTMTVGRRKSAS